MEGNVNDNQENSNNGIVPAAGIKTEVGLEEGNNSSADGSQEVTPSLTVPDEQPVNPWSSVKCIFCDTVLSSSEEPKLLECLHAACSNCVTAKLNEQPADADVNCKFLIFYILAFPTKNNKFDYINFQE